MIRIAILTQLVAMVNVLTVWTSLAAGEDFIITVPIKLHKITTGVHRAKVFCKVYNASDEKIGGKWAISSAIINGELEENITVKFNAYEGKDPCDASYYRCELLLNTPWNTDEPWKKPGFNANEPALMPKAETAFQPEVIGPLNCTNISRARQTSMPAGVKKYRMKTK